MDDLIKAEEEQIVVAHPGAVDQIDIQVATAKRYPRSIKRFKEKALTMATLDEETAASCFYVLPRDKKPIEGPSVRLAEIALSAWGNAQVAARTVKEDDDFVYAESVAWDLESNVAVRIEVRRRIKDKNGKRFGVDMIGVTANAANKIAMRNAVFSVIPFAYVKDIYEQTKKVAIGSVATLAARRSKMIEHFGKMGVVPEKICHKLGRAGVEDITVDDLAVLIGLANALRDGDTTPEEVFPEAERPKLPEGKSGFGFKKGKDSQNIAKEVIKPNDVKLKSGPPKTEPPIAEEEDKPFFDFDDPPDAGTELEYAP